MRLVWLAAICLLGISFTAQPSDAQQMQCPMGTYQWFDSWGNPTCRRFSDGSDAATRSAPRSACPAGSYEWFDSWGNRICRSFEQQNRPQTDYYDTRRGCPTGFYEWRDEWGNPTCRRVGK